VTTAALLAALAVASSSCKPPSEPLEVRKILIDVAPGADGPGGVLERETVRAVIEGLIAGDERFRKSEDRDAAVLRVRLESTALLPPDQGGGASGTLSLSVEVTGGVPGEPLKRYEYRGHSMASLAAERSDGRGIDFTTLVQRAFEDAASQVLAARAAQKEESAALLAWLDDPNAKPEQRYQAVRILGARKETSAVPSLIALLEGSDKELSQAALGALTLIGDARAAAAVIAYAEGKPSLVRKQAIEAIRVMGSPLGRAWLFTLSTGHPDTDVRVAAERALAELEQRPVDLAVTRLAERNEGDEARPRTP
jgi:hypothetical protein